MVAGKLDRYELLKKAKATRRGYYGPPKFVICPTTKELVETVARHCVYQEELLHLAGIPDGAKGFAMGGILRHLIVHGHAYEGRMGEPGFFCTHRQIRNGTKLSAMTQWRHIQSLASLGYLETDEVETDDGTRRWFVLNYDAIAAALMELSGKYKVRPEGA